MMTGGHEATAGPLPVDLTGRRVLILGLGRRGGGEGATRYLAQLGADVVVYDREPADRLVETLARLADVSLDLSLLGTDLDDLELDGWDLVVRNPAIPWTAPILDEFRRREVPIHTEASLFLQDFPGVVVCITGTKGKTSTAFYLHHLFDGADPAADVTLAGNMGGSALASIAGRTSTSRAVMEVSSFQTETIAELGLAPFVACLTNLQQDHQDRYLEPGMTAEEGTQAYWQAKAGLFLNQGPEAWRVHAAELPTDMLAEARGRWFCVFTDHPDAEAAAWIEDGTVYVRRAGAAPEALLAAAELPVEDRHRQENVLVALAAALICGTGVDDLRSRLTTLPTVPHRMEPVPVPGDTVWINDTAASTPTAAAAGIHSRASTGSLTVLCGGAPKHLALDPLVDAVDATGCQVVLLPGEESQRLAELLTARGRAFDGPCDSMQEAVTVAATKDTDTVLLAPGCSSFATNGFGGFADEFDRGGQFVAAVLEQAGIAVSDHLRARLRLPRRLPIAVEIADDRAAPTA